MRFHLWTVSNLNSSLKNYNMRKLKIFGLNKLDLFSFFVAYTKSAYYYIYNKSYLSEKIFEVVEIGHDPQTIFVACSVLIPSRRITTHTGVSPCSYICNMWLYPSLQLIGINQYMLSWANYTLSPGFGIGTQKFRSIEGTRHWVTCKLRAGTEAKAKQPFGHPLWDNMHWEMSRKNWFSSRWRMIRNSRQNIARFLILENLCSWAFPSSI